MTLEKAIAEIERLLDWAKKLQGPQTFVDFRPVPALEMALAALCPVSQEQVERMRGEWIGVGAITCKCSRCQHSELSTRANEYLYCPACGTPMTDEAVDMVMERMEELYEQTSN